LEIIFRTRKFWWFLENLKSGKIAEIIYNQAIAEQNWVEEGKIKLIGVNLYPN
jgi:methylmalonyl-CoA mutase